MKKKAYWSNVALIGKRGVFKAAPFLLLFLIVFVLTSCQSDEWILVVRHQNSEEVYRSERVKPGSEVVVSWVHSVEKTSWQDKLKVTEEGTLLLTETRFQSYGAGVDHENEEGVEVTDGNVVYKEINQELACYRWIHSHKARHSVTWIDGQKLSKEIPHHEEVEICVESR